MKHLVTNASCKILSLVLTIAMIISMLPVTAFAETEPDDTYATSGVTVSETQEDEPIGFAPAVEDEPIGFAPADDPAPIGFAPAAAEAPAPGQISANTIWTGGPLSGNLIVDSGITLTLTGQLTITGNVTISGGGTIKRDAEVYLIKVDGGELTLNDITIDGGNKGDYQTDGGGPLVWVSGGALTMDTGATLQNNSSTVSGGVMLTAGAFIMNGGEITGNTAHDGGGVNVASGTFTMNGGEITGNSASDGGGVFIFGGFGSGTFTMNGGTIGGSEAGDANTASNGGGVYVFAGTFTMNGGEITGNSTTGDGGGVYVGDTPIGDNLFIVGGDAQITGNTKGSDANNFFLPDGKYITLGDVTNSVAVPTSGMSVGVTLASPPTSGHVAFVNIPMASALLPANAFFSDSDLYDVIVVQAGGAFAGTVSLQPAGTAAQTVTLGAGSHGKAGDGQIADLDSTSKYVVQNGTSWYAPTSGTLGGAKASLDAAIEAATELGSTELTGLTNGKTYTVYVVDRVPSDQAGDFSSHNIVFDISSKDTGNTFGLGSFGNVTYIVYTGQANVAAISSETIATQTFGSAAKSYTLSNTNTAGSTITAAQGEKHVTINVGGAGLDTTITVGGGAAVASATISDITVSGTVGAPLADNQTATITLANAAFISISDGATLDWVTNLSRSVSLKVVGEVTAGSNKMTVEFYGTPTAASSAPIEITVPYLQGGTTDLDVTTNPNAKWDIKAAPADTLITAEAITGVTSPVANAVPSTAITDGTNFTAALLWKGNPDTFDYSTAYTAGITLTAATGYTFSGGFANTADIAGFTVNGIAPVWDSNNGSTLSFEVTFPATGAATAPDSATITPTTATFDKNTSAQNHGDIAVLLTPNGREITNVSVDGTPWNSNEHFTYIDGAPGEADQVVFLKDSLSTLAVGIHTITFDMNGGTDPTLTLTVVDTTPTPTYTVTVNSGTGGGDFAAGATVTITADTPPSGQQFKEWTFAPSVTFTDGTNATSATAKFTMPSQAVTATATYEAIPPTPDTTPPTVTANPPENSLLALENAEIVLTFSEPIDTNISSFDAMFTSPTQSVLYGFSWNGDDTVCTLTLGTLTKDTPYTLAITAKDMAGNALTTSIPYRAVWVHDMPSVDDISDIAAPVNFPQAVLPPGTTYTGTGGTIFQHNEVKLIMEQIPTQTKAGLEAVADSAYPNSEHILYLDIALVDANTGAKVQPGQPITLLLPYPAGYSYASTNIFTILHWNSTTNQMEEIIPTPTPNGLQITVTSFSPFAIVVNPAVNPNTSSGSGGGSSSSGGGGIGSAPASTPATQWVDATDAKALAKSAAEQGADSVRTSSSGEAGIRKKALQTLGKSGLTYRHDTVANGAVRVRVYVDDPSTATKDILASGYTSGANADKTTAIMNKWFSNNAAVIALDQQGDFGMNVRIAALANLSGLDTSKLHFYSYDKAANKYKLIATEYKIDSKGYVHFSTVLAGSIIITDRPLTKIGADAEDEGYEPPMTGGGLDNPTTGGDGTGMYIPPAKAQPQDFAVADSIVEAIAADGVLKLESRTVPAAITGNVAGNVNNGGVLQINLDAPNVLDAAKESGKLNIGMIAGIAIALFFASMILWAVIPRKNDPLLSVEEYRKKQ